MRRPKIRARPARAPPPTDGRGARPQAPAGRGPRRRSQSTPISFLRLDVWTSIFTRPARPALRLAGGLRRRLDLARSPALQLPSRNDPAPRHLPRLNSSPPQRQHIPADVVLAGIASSLRLQNVLQCRAWGKTQIFSHECLQKFWRPPRARRAQKTSAKQTKKGRRRSRAAAFLYS